jgi:NCS1 family nucleobase:cation symporter-1
LPESADISTKQLICFFIAWLLQVPFFFIHPSRIQWFFTFKGIIMPIATFGLFGWCMAEGRGISTIGNELTKPADGVPLGWAIVAGINAIMGSLASLIVTQPDLSRYCRKVSDAGWLQGLCVFISKCLVFFLGLAATASIQGAWGKAYWNIWDLLDAVLDHYWTAGARCAVFLVAFAFYCSAIGSNIGTNTIAFGADLTGVHDYRPWTDSLLRFGCLSCTLEDFGLCPSVRHLPWVNANLLRSSGRIDDC